MRVGIEVGGTFTDLIETHGGQIRVAKVPSTPSSPDIGAINAIDAAQIDLDEVGDLIHGSTVATNAVLERKGGNVGAIVTQGTKDIFVLQRHSRKSIYDLNYVRAQSIVDEHNIFEIDERLAPDGSIVTAIDEKRLKTDLETFVAINQLDSVAICLLHSYVNPDHERTVAGILQDIDPALSVTCSHEVSREFREYERASTTVLSAYVQPTIEGYLGRFVRTLEERKFDGRFSIMQSNGGRMPAQAMGRNAIAALFSGPAAGVVGALGMAGRSGFDNIITLDMGGTSTDVSLIVAGMPELTPQTEIDGLPVRTPMIDIVTVGAGGGSIVWLDDGDFLRVGPQSAGASPGPASYMRGGTLPTVTDAHLIRGTLQANSFLGGTMEVDLQSARDSFQELSGQLSMSVEDLADSAIRIAEGNIVRAIQQVSTERGRDPRDFALVAFGGAGPLHAARLAEDLDIATVVVPANAGVLSAVGLLMSDYVHYRSRTERTALDAGAMERVFSILNDLRQEAEAYLRDVGVDEPLTYDHILEMRYVGQAFEVSVVLDQDVESLTQEKLLAAFGEAHHRIFEFSKPKEDPVEIISYRIGARAKADTFPLHVPGVSTPDDKARDSKELEIVEGGELKKCQLVVREMVTVSGLEGPALIEDGTSTVFVPQNWTVRLDQTNCLILERRSEP